MCHNVNRIDGDADEFRDCVYDAVLEMMSQEEELQRKALIQAQSLHEIAYRKGKVQALHDVLELLRKTPE